MFDNILSKHEESCRFQDIPWELIEIKIVILEIQAHMHS